MRKTWNKDEKSKFVVTETEAYFVSMEETSDVPSLARMLLDVTNVDLTDVIAVEAMDEKLEDGRVLLGYVYNRTVEIHSPVDDPHHHVLARLGEVFGEIRVTASGWTVDLGKPGREA